MQVEWVELHHDDRVELAGLRPVSFAHIQKLELLLEAISTHQIPTTTGENFEEVVSDLAQKTINLHPRVDLIGGLGFDIDLLTDEGFEALFQQGGLARLNAYKPIEPNKKEKPDPNPPWSSGDVFDDWLSDLTYSLNGSYRDAIAIVETRSYQSVNNLLKRLGDLHKGPEGRETEQSQQFFEEQVGTMDGSEFDDWFGIQETASLENKDENNNDKD